MVAIPGKWEFRGVNIRITEKRRLETAAPAIKHRIVNRSRPRVFLPVLPLKKGSIVGSMAMAGVDGLEIVGRGSMSTDMLLLKLESPAFRCRGQSGIRIDT